MDILKTRWAVGQSPRGHDRFNYAIITEDTGRLVLETKDIVDYDPLEIHATAMEVAAHIVDLHNATLPAS